MDRGDFFFFWNNCRYIRSCKKTAERYHISLTQLSFIVTLYITTVCIKSEKLTCKIVNWAIVPYVILSVFQYEQLFCIILWNFITCVDVCTCPKVMLYNAGIKEKKMFWTLSFFFFMFWDYSVPKRVEYSFNFNSLLPWCKND